MPISDLFRDKLQIVANDELLLNAIRAVFDEVIEKRKPMIIDQDNELLGQEYRAYELSKKIIEQGFVDLGSYKISKNPIRDFNKER